MSSMVDFIVWILIDSFLKHSFRIDSCSIYNYRFEVFLIWFDWFAVPRLLTLTASWISEYLTIQSFYWSWFWKLHNLFLRIEKLSWINRRIEISDSISSDWKSRIMTFDISSIQICSFNLHLLSNLLNSSSSSQKTRQNWMKTNYSIFTRPSFILIKSI